MNPTLVVLSDYVEEGWTSMDYCARMLIQHLDDGGVVRPVPFCPSFRRRFQRLPISIESSRIPFNADRLFNRLWDYPRKASGLTTGYDLFHVCDHSYAQIVHSLPLRRTGVYCHDLDAFRSLLEPQVEPRPFWYRIMMRHILDGLSKAAIVFCSTVWLKSRLSEAGLVKPERIVLAPYGVADEFSPETDGTDSQLPLSFDRTVPYVLHVGATIPRKRIDVLLEIFARVRSRFPEIRLVQIGGTWTKDQEDQIARLGIGGVLTQLRGIERATLAALYRQAAVVLLPSQSEGFGLPLVEAIASGAIVIASDIPVLREVGGPVALYQTVGDPVAWSASVVDVLARRVLPLPRDARLAWASKYSWSNQAKIIAEAYLELPVRALTLRSVARTAQ